MMGGEFSVTLQRNRFADKTGGKFGFSWTEIVALFNQKPAAWPDGQTIASGRFEDIANPVDNLKKCDSRSRPDRRFVVGQRDHVVCQA